MATDDEDDTGKPIDTSGLTPKPPGAKTGSPVPPGVAPPSPSGSGGRNFTFTAEVFGVGSMLEGGGHTTGKAQSSPQPPDQRPFFNPTGDAGVDGQYQGESRLTKEGERIHTQLDRDNRIDADGRDLDAPLAQYESQYPEADGPDPAQLDRFNEPRGEGVAPDDSALDRFNAPSEANASPDERDLDRFNAPGARQVPSAPSPDDDGPGASLSDEFNQRGGPGRS